MRFLQISATLSRKSLQLCISVITISFLFFLIDYFVLGNRAIFVTLGELSVEITFIVSFVFHYLSKHKTFSVFQTFIFLFSVCFFISDFSFAVQYYFNLHSNEFISVSSITIPNTFGFFFSFSALAYELRRYFQSPTKDNHIVRILLPMFIFTLFLTMAFILFGGRFTDKYGSISSDPFNFFRIGAIFSGVLTATMGAMCLCISENVILSLLGLGLYLQVMGDWAIRLKEYLHLDSLLGSGEYFFFAGLAISLGSTFLLDSRSNQNNSFRLTTISASQRTGFLLPLNCFAVISTYIHGSNANVIELFFLFNCIVAILIYRSTVISVEHVERIRSQLNQSFEGVAQDFTPLPYELATLSEEITCRSIELEKMRAVALTAQYLSHDVRRPFLLAKMGLDLLQSVQDMKGLKEVLKVFIPNLKRATTEVDSILNNVVEVSQTGKLAQEPCSLQSLVEQTLQNTIPIFPKKRVMIEFDFNHSNCLFVDVSRCKRVFTNIVYNALQAIVDPSDDSSHTPERIWFSSTDKFIDSEPYIEIEIGNSGSFIPESIRQSIFENFYSSGKKSGSGLGLAISKKVVEHHKGKIECFSSEIDRHVKFKILLPALSIAGHKPLRNQTILSSVNYLELTP